MFPCPAPVRWLVGRDESAALAGAVCSVPGSEAFNRAAAIMIGIVILKAKTITAYPEMQVTRAIATKCECLGN